jgi:Fe-S cluster assembly protein SufD
MSTSTSGPDAARAIAKTAGEPEWLASWRLSAWESFETQPMPDRVDHLWRYTEPEKFLTDKVAPLLPANADLFGGASAAAADSLLAKFREESGEQLAGVLVQDDADAVTFGVDPAWRDAGVIVTGLSSAVREHADLVEPYLGKIVPFEQGKFAGLNAALFVGGVFIYVPKGVELDVPVHAVFRSGKDLSAVFPRTLVVLEDGAAATFIDEYASAPNASVNGASPRVVAHSVVEAHVGQNARLQYVNLQNWGMRTRSHHTQRAHIQRDGSMIGVNVGLGGLYNKADIATELRGGNAYSEMIGVLFGDRNQHFDNHTEHMHVHGNTFSDLDFKVVLEDQARSAYTGLIRIEHDAGNSEAYQENRNLLLDSDCRAESIPELEILNEDVRCTHGATIGPIDEEQVFYLMTRGLSRRAAQRAIVEGFFAPALDRIEEEALNERLWSYVRSKLHKLHAS